MFTPSDFASEFWPRWRRWSTHPFGETALVAAFFMILVLLALGRFLFFAGDTIVSNGEQDLATQFVAWRSFGFGELQAGRLALWNPHIYCGIPFLGGFQSALLYPPNWLYLCLPLASAINIGIALHVFLIGFFMYLWARWHGLHPLASTIAGVWLMFSGPYFLHIYAGHLPNLCAMAWGPLIFLSIDGWMDRRTLPWLLLGTAAVAMQILAGHPQYVFYTGVAAGFYASCRMYSMPRRIQAATGLGAIAAGAVALSAIQLFEGFHAAGESVRSQGTSMQFAAMFSFPPENFLTLLTPQFFGNLKNQPYWGRCYLWEMSLFFGVSGFVCAVYGATTTESRKRWLHVVLVVSLLLMAAGSHTPLFKLLYDDVPGFNRFRGWSKFTFPAMLLMVMLAAKGFDAMWRRRPHRAWAWGLAGSGLAFVVLAWGLCPRSGAEAGAISQPWANWVQSLFNTHESALTPELPLSPDFVQKAGMFASHQLLVTALMLLALGAAFGLASRWSHGLSLLLVVAIAEMLIFAHSSLDGFHLAAARASPVSEYLAIQPRGDYRVFNQINPNLAMIIGAREIWGYDPGVLRRYAEWMAATQNINPNDASQVLTIQNIAQSFCSMLRCQYIFLPPQPSVGSPNGSIGQPQIFDAQPESVSPRLLLVPQAKVIPARDEIFAAMRESDFDPRKSVILETPPSPPPANGDGTGTVALVAETTDTMVIEADLPQAAILLVTDTYCTGWRARSLMVPGNDGGDQVDYTVQPANYFMRAIALRAGHHRLMLEYRPIAFVIGQWTSLAAIILYMLTALWVALKRSRLFQRTRLGY